MGIKTSSLEEVGDIMLNSFGDYKQLILRELWNNLMETTPEKTGTLKHNWRYKVGPAIGSYYAENDGSFKSEYIAPDEKFFDKRWNSFTIYNNSEYIVKVNNGEGGNGHNQNFIQRALAMTDARF